MDNGGALDGLGLHRRRRRFRRRALVVTLAGIVALMGWLVLIDRAEGQGMTLVARGAHARGVLTEVSPPLGGGLTAGAVDVGYLYDGKYFQGHVFLDDSSPRYRVGQSVVVTVDPSQPQDVTVAGSDNESPSFVWMAVGLLVAGLILLILGLAFLLNGSSFARRARLRAKWRNASAAGTK
jgi:uncharacterized protein DUF3592